MTRKSDYFVVPAAETIAGGSTGGWKISETPAQETMLQVLPEKNP